MMENLFLTLLNISINAGYLVLAVLLLRPLLKKAPKYIRCILWSLVGVRLAIPVSVESVLSLIPSTETVPQEILYASDPQINSGIPFVNSAVNPMIADSLSPTVGYSVNPMQIVVAVAWNLWILGMLAMVLYSVVSYLRLRYKLREAVCDTENIWLCDHIGSAFLLGIFKPRIYLPSDLEGENKAFVIAHEKAHLHRKDHWWKPLGYLLLTVYWFNPLMWVGYIFLCRDIEFACDEKVLKEMGADCKKAYSEALISCSIPKKMISACPVAFGEEGVRGRVKSILNYKKPAFWLILIAILACVAVAVCFLTNPVEPAELFGYTYETGKCHYSYVVDKDKETQTNQLTFIIDPLGDVTEDFGDNAQQYLGSLELSEFDLQTLNQVLQQQSGVSLSLGRRGKAFEIRNADGVRQCVFFHKRNGDVVYISFFSDGKVMNVFDLDRKGRTPPAEIQYSFNATVLEIQDNAVVVVPSLYEDELQISDRFVIPMTQEQILGVTTGDTIWIGYDGIVEELYPAKIPNVLSVILVAENDWYADPSVAFSSTQLDIDGDGIVEDCYLSWGPTSGVCTIVVSAYENNIREYATTYSTVHMNFSFKTLESGETVIEGAPYDESEEKRIFHISVNGWQIVLTENGQQLQLWGSKDFAIPTTSYLRRIYPEFFDLSTAKGLEVYVWNNGTWRCGVRSGTNRNVTQEEIMAFGEGADLTEMAVILASYGLSKSYVSICYNYNPREPGYHEELPSKGEQEQIEQILFSGLTYHSFPTDAQYPLVIYAYQLGENAWRFQFLHNTTVYQDVLDLMFMDAMSTEDAVKALSAYDLSPGQIPVVVYTNPISSYMYSVDEETTQAARAALGLA